MKRNYLLLAFMLIHFILFAQKHQRTTLNLLQNSLEEKIKLPFTAFRIIDARYEQNTIGCIIKDVSFKGMTDDKMLAVLPEKLIDYLPKVLSDVTNFDKDNKDTLVILIKQFRITDRLATTVDKRHDPETLLTLSCSFYKAENNHIAKISSFDDVLAVKWELQEPTKKEMDSIRVRSILKMLKAAFTNRSWQASQSTFPLDEVEKTIKQRFQLPLFHDTVLVAGLYKNYQEFQRNAPTVFDFQVGWKDNEIQEIRDAQANLITPRSFWGLCIGKDRYVCFAGRLYKLYPITNSFYIKFRRLDPSKISSIDKPYVDMNGAFNFDNRDAIFFAPDVINLFKRAARQEYLYLNMETGKVHTEELLGNAKHTGY